MASERYLSDCLGAYHFVISAGKVQSESTLGSEVHVDHDVG